MSDQLARFAELMGKHPPLKWDTYTCECCSYLVTPEHYVVQGQPALAPDLAKAICAAVNTSDAFVRVAKAAKTAAYAMGGSMGPIIGLKEALADLEKALAEEMG